MYYFTRSNSVCQKADKNCVLPYTICLCLLVFTLSVFLSSCAAVGKYNPDPKIAIGSVKGINVTNAVKISNSQPSSEEHLLEFRGIVVDYKAFTQSLVEALKMEYERNNVIVSDSAERELQVAVTKIEMYMGSANFRATIFAEVKYGNGSIEKFDASRASYASGFMVTNFPTKPLNAAFKDLVAEIINNKNIQMYINK
jgi:hypothetical protein